MRPKLTPGQAGAEPVSVAASLFPARPPALPHARPAAVGPGTPLRPARARRGQKGEPPGAQGAPVRRAGSLRRWADRG